MADQAGDTTPPTLQSTTATRNQLILTFSEDIQIAGDGKLHPAYMTVTVDDEAREITGSQILPPNQPSIHTASQLALTLSGRSLDGAQSFSISYNPPSNGSNTGFITDLDDNALASIAYQVVDTYSSSSSISTRGLSSAYKNLILTGTAAAGYGNIQDNTITGNDANNTLDGRAGADSMIGKGGNDTYFMDNVGDVVTEIANEGTDTVQSTITYTLADNLENLTLLGSGAINGTGNGTKNIITGNTAANVLNGNGGTDSLIGGRGNDTYIVDSNDDSITESGLRADADSVESSVSWILGINLENLTLTGSSAINGTGNNLNNAISGNSVNNILDGGNGGTDRLTGLEGADIFKFTFRPNSFITTTADHITDFSSSQGDKIQITKSALRITGSTATLSVVNGITAANTALASSSQFIYDTSSGELHWNQNGITRGAGSGGVLAILDNKATLNAGDLILV
jgi:Ca2+-binding RTX toxin-like protein